MCALRAGRPACCQEGRLDRRLQSPTDTEVASARSHPATARVAGAKPLRYAPLAFQAVTWIRCHRGRSCAAPWSLLSVWSSSASPWTTWFHSKRSGAPICTITRALLGCATALGGRSPLEDKMQQSNLCGRWSALQPSRLSLARTAASTGGSPQTLAGKGMWLSQGPISTGLSTAAVDKCLAVTQRVGDPGWGLAIGCDSLAKDRSNEHA